MKRYGSGNKIVRRIHVPEKFNEKDDLERYDRALQNGQRYCIVTIRLLAKPNLAPSAEKQDLTETSSLFNLDDCSDRAQ